MPQQPFDPSLPSTSAAGGARPTPAAAATPAAAVARRLAGVRRVTLSVPGVLLEESSPDELEESANVCAGAAGAGGWESRDEREAVARPGCVAS